MPKCEFIRKKKRRVCVGDMKDVITLNNRDITPPLFNTVDFDENFDPIDVGNPESFSLIETVTGKTFFDGVNTETPITHIIYIPYNENVTAETWITFEDRRIDILRVEDFDERHQFMKLTCNERGLTSREATKI